MLSDAGRKMDLLNSWPPAVGAKPEPAVEVGTALGDAIKVLERVFGVATEVVMGAGGVVVILNVVHIDTGGTEYSSHWPCRSAP